jgi:hypothetical protein
MIPWRWKEQVTTKPCWLYVTLHDVASQKRQVYFAFECDCTVFQVYDIEAAPRRLSYQKLLWIDNCLHRPVPRNFCLSGNATGCYLRGPLLTFFIFLSPSTNMPDNTLSYKIRSTPLQMYDSVNHSTVLVGIATSYELDGEGVGVRVAVGANIFSVSSTPVLGSTQLSIQWVPGALSPEVKRLGREADHSPPAIVEVKNVDLIHTLPHTPSWRSA